MLICLLVAFAVAVSVTVVVAKKTRVAREIVEFVAGCWVIDTTNSNNNNNNNSSSSNNNNEIRNTLAHLFDRLCCVCVCTRGPVNQLISSSLLSLLLPKSVSLLSRLSYLCRTPELWRCCCCCLSIQRHSSNCPSLSLPVSLSAFLCPAYLRSPGQPSMEMRKGLVAWQGRADMRRRQNLPALS